MSDIEYSVITSDVIKSFDCIQYLIKVKLLFSALDFTIISYIDLYIVTDYHNLVDGDVRCSYKGGIYYNNDQK